MSVVDDLDAFGLLVQHLAPGAAVVLVAPFDVGRRDRRAVVELGARPQPEGRALGVLGKLEVFGQRRMVVARLAEVLDQRVVQRHEEIVRARRAVMLLRVEPARGDVGVPGQRHLALWHHCGGGLLRDANPASAATPVASTPRRLSGV